VPPVSFGVALDFGSALRPLDAQLERQLRLAQQAEAAGFELVAAGESAAPGGFHLPNAVLVLATLARHTRLRLCTGVVLLPAWSAWKLALDAAQLDQLSGGRLVLGVGLGSAALHARAGWPAGAVGETADETLAAIHALWSGASEYRGEHVSVGHGLPILPRQPAGPPIWVGGSIRRSAVRAARYGDGWYAGVGFPLSRVGEQSRRYRDALAAAGRDVRTGVVAVNRVALAAPSSAEVSALAERYLPASTLQTAQEACLLGTPDEIVAQVERYRAAGTSHVFARLSLDEMPGEVAGQTIDLFRQYVIPRFRA
jgi:alkanesulfonate monooxygenase SsuD/methylene tetrahydromethanopterin reductase-like flavin-dependent oxidoreductase (luciferase family)